jgi:hypothetical protein
MLSLRNPFSSALVVCPLYRGDFAMADNRSKKIPADTTKINLSERYEFDYWKRKFSVSEKELTAAVKAVGVQVKVNARRDW